MALLGNLTGSAPFFQDAVGFYNGVATQSLRFDDGSSAYLSRTPSSAGNRRTWTWSGWVKFTSVSIDGSFFTTNGSDDDTLFSFILASFPVIVFY